MGGAGGLRVSRLPARVARPPHLSRSTVNADQHAFSLIELLAVICILAVLAALLLPALTEARDDGRRISCRNNLKQLTAAVQMYTSDNDGKLPENNPGPTNTWVN